MHIRKLEISGFKSFADRAVFHFGPGISGVVGPNGCGKSNVVDAVKWCLGEQSAKSLRGTNMSDIIFAGTQARPAMGVAEVALTFASDDVPFAGEYAHHAEVRIARRLYRDGASEYRINEARCRLKDIQDLFLDTGANNRLYSFIEQGRIGQIISARPEQRRALIEEAAGISRYKARKEEADKRLADTLANLEEASRALDDMSGRLRTLERQVRKAVRYRRLRSRVRQGEVFLGLARFSGLVADRRVLAEQMRGAEAGEAAAIRGVTRLEEALTVARQQLRGVEEAAGRLRDELAELEASRRETESARQYQGREQQELERRVAALAGEVEQAGNQETAARARHEEARREREQVERQLAALEAGAEEARQRLAAAEAAVRARRQAIERGKDAVLARVQKLARGRAELDGAVQRRQELGERIARLVEQEGQVGVGIHALQAAVDEARGAEAGAQERVAAAREAVAAAAAAESQGREAVGAARQALRQAEQARDGLEEQRGKAARQVAAVRARVEALEQLQAAHAGVDDALRPALAVDGVLGTLAEHLDVPAELEQLLAVILGSDLDLLLARDDAAAAAAAAAIQAGRVGVLSLQGAVPAEQGLAARVGGTPAGRAALGRLLGGAQQAPDAAQALAVHRREGGVVLVEGPPAAVVGATGALRVGRAAGAGLAILARRRELAATREALLRDEQAEAEASARVEEARRAVEERRVAQARASEALERSGELATAARTTAGEAEMALRLASRERADRERERDNEIARQDRLGKELEGLRARLAEGEERLGAMKVELARLQEEQAAAEEALHRDQAALVGEEQAAEAGREQRAGLAAQVAGLRERILALGREERASLDAATQAAGRAAATREELARGQARIAELRADDARLDQRLVELAARQEDTTARLAEARARVEAERARITRQEEELRKAREEQVAATAARSALDRQLAQVKADIAHIRDSLEERHELSAAALLDRIDRVGHVVIAADEGAAGELPPDEEAVAVEDLRITAAMLQDEARIAAAVDELQRDRAALQRLGEVNLVAQQEYDEVKERHDTLLARREDLEESVRTIRQTIGKLNKTCRERFRDTFDRVNAYFQETYPRLVGGGQARLLLTDEEDMLETGVDIMVQPPGKKLQSLTLLSGGEMAMTAIALIFSLFRVKPSPFCLLDEVDAPLDEGNGARFNQMLREMAKLSQFIVITHNKKTMECADTLYGVTMAVPGVSRLVTVQLD